MTNITKQCQHCGKDFQAKSSVAKFCDRKCQRAAAYIRLQQTGKRCKVDGCDKAAHARGMCMTHWGRDYRKAESTKYTFTCDQCGKQFTRATKQKLGRKKNFCNPKCSQANAAVEALLAREPAKEKTPETVTCVQCGKRFKSLGRTTCSAKCHNSLGYSKLTKALVEKNNKDALAAIKGNTITTVTGCHEWQGQVRDNYPIVKSRGKTLQVHRLVLELKYNAPLGTQAAHHKCANSKCVNPSHLQPVTHRENIAEMLARHSYLNRIKELEDELRKLDPTNDLLQLIPVS